MKADIQQLPAFFLLKSGCAVKNKEHSLHGIRNMGNVKSQWQWLKFNVFKTDGG